MKKILFIALVLIGSLFALQYVLLQQTITPETGQNEEQVVPENVIHKTKAQMFDAGDYIVVLKDGKYYVYKKNLPST